MVLGNQAYETSASHNSILSGHTLEFVGELISVKIYILKAPILHICLEFSDISTGF